MTEKLDQDELVQSNIKCPFCIDSNIKAEPGKSECTVCHAKFEIDDRVECVFVDLDNPRLPVKGTYCSQCGLVQGVYRKYCRYCRAIVRHKIQ